MELYWTKRSPTNTALVDSTGQTRYKIETPFRLALSTRTSTTISTIIPSDLLGLGEDNDLKSLELVMKDRFAFLAHIEWNNVGPNTLRFGGEEYNLKTYLRSDGLLSQHRIFTMPDGKQYRWNLGPSGMQPPVLEPHDGSKTLIAMFHGKQLGITKKRSACYLEILPKFVHLVDIIVVTFVYVDHIRRKRQAAARAACGGAGGTWIN